MNPSDMNGRSGLTRVINASPNQMASLKAMLDSGELVSSETMLQHGQGVAFDDEDLFFPNIKGLPEGLSKNEFSQRFTQVDSPEYLKMVRSINQKIAALPIHQTQ